MPRRPAAAPATAPAATPATSQPAVLTARLAALALAVWGFATLGCGEPSKRPGSRPAGLPPAAAAQPATAAGYDLGPDERLGGHTLARHVGRTPDELASRLENEPGLRAASSFPDRATAERAVALALVTQRDRLERWQARGARRPNLALDVRASDGRPFGVTLARGDPRPRVTRSARVVLRARGSGFYVLTAYPTEER